VGLRLLVLTWVRTTELRMMLWSEIEGATWRLAAGRMKRRRDHIVPLSRQALVLIETMRRRATGSPYVFSAPHRADRPMSEKAMLYLLNRMGYGGRMTGHGMRTLGSTWAHEHGYPPDVIERQLAHVPDDKVRAAYNRAAYLPQRATMLQGYADWIESQC
jgi:integrase